MGVRKLLGKPLIGSGYLGDLAALAADVAIFGAPHGTPYEGIDNREHAGTAAAVRKALGPDGEWTDHWDFDLDGPLLAGSALRVVDIGDLSTESADGPGNRLKIEAATRAVLAAGAVPMMLGGDDSVPIPFIAGFADRGPITILQIDAHIDWRDERLGERHGFSSTMRRASEMAHVNRIVQVGQRALGSARQGEVEAAKAWGAVFIPARQVLAAGVGAALAAIEPGASVVITIDCDALDPAVMPAVQAPTPGGLNYWHISDLIGGVAERARIVGFDVIEFMPARDATGAAAYLVGRLFWHAIGQLARGHRR